MSTKFRAALKMSTLTPDGKVTAAQNMVNAMQAAPGYFPVNTLPISFVNLNSAITGLHNSIITAAAGAAGSLSNMHDKERYLLTTFNLVRAYVEMQANNTSDPQTVIEAAGMTAVAGGGGSAVAELTLTASGNGEVLVEVPRGPGEAAFIYQYSADAGVTWQEFGCSKLASITLGSQTPATTLYFRYAAIGKNKGAFSQSKNVIVL